MNIHRKKILTTIITALCIIACLVAYTLLTMLELPTPIKIVGIIAVSISIIVLIVVLVQRIKEIKIGEEDDLSKY